MLPSGNENSERESNPILNHYIRIYLDQQF